MIFTTKGLLGNTKINQIYVLSILIDQTYMPDEIIKVSKDIRKRESWPAEGDEIFVKAKEISDLRNKKEYLEQKYKNLREKCLQKEANLKKSIAWKIFFNLLRFADYIFDGYSIPFPLRTLLTEDRSKPGTIFFPTSLNIKTSKFGSHQKRFFESEELCDAVYSGKVIDTNFLRKIIYPCLNKKNKPSFPTDESDYIESPIDLNKYLIRNRSATMLYRAQGQSNREHGINDGDIMIVDQSQKPEINDIVVAMIDGEFICGCLEYRKNGFVIDKKDKVYKDFEACHFEIMGVVTSSITKH